MTVAFLFSLCSSALVIHGRAQVSEDQVASTSAQTRQLPTLWVVGDSTANNKWNGGWGQALSPFFDLTKVRIENSAVAGSSSRTFVHEDRWRDVAASIRSGDLVLIAFGHNDGGPSGAPKYRGSLPGLGDETQVVSLPDGSVEIVHTYGWYVKQMVDEAKAKHARPILVGTTVRNVWTDGKIERSMGGFDGWDLELARQEHITFIDLTSVMAARFEALGEARVTVLFPNDHTHNNPAGGEMNAEAVIAALRRIRGLPVGRWLSQRGRSVQKIPAHFIMQQSHRLN